MARWAPAKRDTMRAIAAETTQHHRAGREVIAVTGGPGRGVLGFADDLVAELRDSGRRVVLADAAGFERVPGVESDSGATPARLGLRRRELDERALRRALVDPFRLGGSTGFQTAVYDPLRGVPLVSEWSTAGPDAVLVVAGRGLLRPSLAGLWDVTVWVDAPLESAASADAASAGATTPAWFTDQEWSAHLADGDPRAAASATVDRRDPDHPRRVFADSC